MPPQHGGRGVEKCVWYSSRGHYVQQTGSIDCREQWRVITASASMTHERTRGFLLPGGDLGGDHHTYVLAVEPRREECNPRQEWGDGPVEGLHRPKELESQPAHC